MKRARISASSSTASESSPAPTLSLIVPVKDEEPSIEPFLSEVVPVLDRAIEKGDWEILFIDDGSQDKTLAIVERMHALDRRIKAISFSRSFGKEAALSAGLDFAQGAAVIPIDVDLQDPPSVIEEMVAQWRKGFDVVNAVRDDRSGDSILKRGTAKLYYRTYNLLAAHPIPENVGDFRLMDRTVVEALRRMPERNRFMKGLFAWAGFNQTSVKYKRPQRASGTTKFRYLRLWTLALDGITATSTVPLRMWSYVGSIIAVLSILYAIFLIVRTLALGVDVPGYASLMVVVLFFGSLQLISLGILGEYVGRILIEANQRPIYVVKGTVGIEEGQR